MKTVSLFALAAMLLAGNLFGQIRPPIWIGDSYASVTFFGDTVAPPALSGPPTVIDTVMLYYASQSNNSVTLAEIRGDSLIFETGAANGPGDPIPLAGAPIIILPGVGYKIAFNNAGVYKAYERVNVICIRDPCPPIMEYRGDFRILPKTVITPSPVTVRDSLKLRLLLGQGDCWPSYNTSFRIEGSLIHLSFPHDSVAFTCVDAAFPVPFGPSFNPGILEAGTYQIMIEDSVPVANVTVYDNILVFGNVVPMTDPRCLSCGMSAPISGATVFAVPAPQCSWLPMLNAAATETLRTESDSIGQFTLNIPNTGTDYEITVLGKGYYPQTMYLNSYPMMESYPPQVGLSYELIQDTDSALGGCEITVTGLGGAPVESAYVSLSGGRELLLCMYEVALAKTAAGTTYLYGYTDRQGKITFKNASLDPYIDYAMSVGRNSEYASGLIRLNRFIDLSYDFTLNVVGVEANATMATASWLEVRPNPFNSAVNVSFSNPDRKASLAIYDIGGKLVRSFKNVTGNGVSWSAQSLPSGLYLLKAKIQNQEVSAKLFLNR